MDEYDWESATDSEVWFADTLDQTFDDEMTDHMDLDALLDVLVYEFDRSTRTDGYLLGGNAVARVARDFIKELGTPIAVPPFYQALLNNSEDLYNKYPKRRSEAWRERFPDPWIPKFPKDPILEKLHAWLVKRITENDDIRMKDYSKENLALRTLDRYRGVE